MEDQDGISIRPMRLKVLYTFDDESKTNCLARWPHVLQIQTAFLDEDIQVGVIELKTCIQAIVSASPELVAKLGRDYTVYAYDYSEYETPLVGQGMLSWVLASSSPTPNAPAHQSRTMVTGRVCQNAGLFARGAQETLEVKLRLVPVPSILQSEYLNSMQKYRELSTVIPQDFDAQAWTSFVQSNPGLFAGSDANPVAERDAVDRSGIENVHRMLSEGSGPRDLSNLNNFHADSPAQFTNATPSRTSTPGIVRPMSQQQKRNVDETFRPSSRGSVQHPNAPTRRRGSIMSGYGSSDETAEGPVQKRAKLMRADLDKTNMNIERQPGSLRVAASTAASVRIHRPTPLNPTIQAAQASNEDPVRPPTPVPSAVNAPTRRIGRPPQSNLRRQSSTFSQHSHGPPYMSEERRAAEMTSGSPPDEMRYAISSETPFNMPSSPPVMDMTCPQTSSPVLPPLPDQDSGFMSGNFEPLDDENANNEYHNTQQQNNLTDMANSHTSSRPAVPSASGNPAAGHQHRQIMSDGTMSARNPAPVLPPQPRKAAGSRPSSRASVRGSKPLAPAPAPVRQADVGQSRLPLPPVPVSDPVQPLQHPINAQTPSCPMSDMPMVSTPGSTNFPDGKIRSGAGARRVKQVQARLDQCIKQGTVPPYCENCGAIETTTWRRAWSKVIEGSAENANACINDPGMLFWEAVDTETDGTVTSYRQFKKSLANEDRDYIQLLLCNPCGLWLHKFKNMRPENKWNKPPNKDKRKRKSNRRPPAVPAASTRSQMRLLAAKRSGSSPPPTEASSPPEETTPKNGNSVGNNGVSQPHSNNRRANSAEPPKSTNKNDRWQQEDAFEALRRAIQSSPARNMEARKVPFMEPNLTPNPVRRTLFQSSKEDSAMKTLSEALVNSVRRSPRSTPKNSKQGTGAESNSKSPGDGLDHLFEGGEDAFLDIDPPNSPTPRQKNRTPNTRTVNKENVGVPSEQPKEFTSSENQQTLQESPNAAKGQNGDIGTLSLWNSPNSKNFETINGLVLNIFESDDESLTHTDSFQPFVPPKAPASGDWVDWDPDCVSPRDSQIAEGGANEQSGRIPAGLNDDNTSPSIVDGFQNKEAQAPNDASNIQSGEDAEFRSLLLATATGYTAFNDSSAISDTDIFDPALVDPQLLSGMWSKDGSIAASPSGGKNSGVDQFDAEVFSAIIQEVTGKPSST
ncbi:hypothetical protein CPC735_016860 [Coccidioides posadasii C735 delta SOWgp]|uniref:Ams2/SPT21 N-terminal domain-containing protein n=1 Tax=Coccidioides posadasii (strain C735) TaxID=222929 RepID=C5PDC4_COCP7|nr:hypothetical protein CPC735_016860 [Coccidioides posadasii C735 delta SOWgp]EER25085.1 hypothetical protein CPC735_016860 [Coccidioides posadasii C735 delta SOWgp]|eukprot:XP_003067230.1 hypothetical protein CPC735_016860 [Coccidioides posadasii C735 delta SOWgp]